MMTRSVKTTIAAALLTLAAGAADARTVYSTVPTDLSNAVAELPESGYCNTMSSSANCAGGKGQTVVYSSFSLGAATTLTGFGYYSYFDGSTYAGTQWWIYRAGSTTPIAFSENAVGAVQSSGSDPELVQVDIPGVALDASTTYWIGIENEVTDPDDAYSQYATTGSNDGDTFVGRNFDGSSFAVGNTRRTSQSAFELESDIVAVPEPSTWAMMLAGLAGLAWAGRRGLAGKAA